MDPTLRREVADTPSKGNASDKIILKVFGSIGAQATDASPFVAKLQAYLKLAGIPYEEHWADLSESPKGTGPYIAHGPNVIADSSLIIKYLKNTYGDAIQLKPVTDPTSDAIGLTVQRTIEDHLYYGAVFYRWLDEEAWENGFVYKELCGKSLPSDFAGDGSELRQYYTKRVFDQGLLKHSKKDMDGLINDSLRAISAILHNKRYILGEQPSEYDATVFGFLDCMLYDNIAHDLGKAIRKYDNLVQYTDRIRKQYFGVDPGLGGSSDTSNTAADAVCGALDNLGIAVEQKALAQ